MSSEPGEGCTGLDGSAEGYKLEHFSSVSVKRLMSRIDDDCPGGCGVAVYDVLAVKSFALSINNPFSSPLRAFNCPACSFLWII